MVENKISIIVPIYNAEKYLYRCIKSIVNQTYQNIELILVNDGSSDKSGEICEQWSKVDHRIQYFSQRNTGVGTARNLGLKKCSGDFVTFVDSDDYLDVTFCEELMSVLINRNSDIACCMARRISTDGNINISGRESCDIFTCSNKEFEYYGEKERREVWGSIYKKGVIENIRFDEELAVGEDTLFFAMAVCNSHTLAYYDKPLYNYIIRDNSAYHGSFDQKKRTELNAWSRVCNVFVNEPLTQLSAEAVYAQTCLDMIRKYVNDPEFDQDMVKEVIQIYRKHLWKLLKFDRIKHCSMFRHIMIGLFPKLFVTCRGWKKTNGKN